MVARPLVEELAICGGLSQRLLSGIPVGVSNAKLRLLPRFLAWSRRGSTLLESLARFESGPLRRS